MAEKISCIITRLVYKILGRMRGISKKWIPNVTIGKKLFCEKNVVLDTYYGGNISIGDNCSLMSGCKLLSYGGKIIIGNRCSVNPYTILYGQGNLIIGNDVRIATQCVIIPSNHNYQNSNIPIIEQGLCNKGIIIEDDVWIGCGVRILDGVIIKRGCVLGAGCVVTKSTEPYGVYAGIPARLIKKRGVNE